MKRCFIYAAGTFYGLRESPREDELQIAGRRGTHLCERLGVRPDVVLGDFDSMDASEAPGGLHPRAGREGRHRHHARAARGTSPRLRYLLSLWRDGGARLDHTLANIQSLAFLLRHRARGYLYDRDFVYTVIENETLALEREVDWGIVSLFSMATAPSTSRSRGCNIRSRTDDRLRLPARCEQSHRRRRRRASPWARAAARRLGAAEIGRGGVKFSHGERQSRSVGWHSL